MNESASTVPKTSRWSEIFGPWHALVVILALVPLVIDAPRHWGRKKFGDIPKGTSLREVESMLGAPRSTVVGTNGKRDPIPSGFGSRLVFSPAVGCKGIVYDIPWTMTLIVMHFDVNEQFTHLEENGT